MERKRLSSTVFAMVLMAVPCLWAARPQPSQLKVVELDEPGGQILSYRTGSTQVEMRGTRLAPNARIRMKVGSRPGFVEIDINRGNISGLEPAHRLGKDFLTYVLWAVSVDGRASNLGEITFDGERAISINVTTPYQTFWLMVTAEPNYAVVDPSPKVVLYSVSQNGVKEPPERKALTIKGDLFYFTHYAGYDAAPGDGLEGVPNELLQARKAVELASRSGLQVATPKGRRGRMREEEHTRQALEQATEFLQRAEQAYKANPKGSDVVQFARTAAQIAENSRALAQGAVGGILLRQMEQELAMLREQLAALQSAPPAAVEQVVEPVAETPETPVPQPVQGPVLAMPSKPVLWLGLLGWGLFFILLFRRHPFSRT